MTWAGSPPHPASVSPIHQPILKDKPDHDSTLDFPPAFLQQYALRPAVSSTAWTATLCTSTPLAAGVDDLSRDHAMVACAPLLVKLPLSAIVTNNNGLHPHLPSAELPLALIPPP